MKKYLVLAFLVLGSTYVRSQSIDDIRKLIILTQYDKAKVELDKFFGDPKNAGKAEAWYYKSFTYSALARQASKPAAESKILFQESFDAFKKYRELDPKAPLTTEENNSSVYNLYYGYYDMGVKMYNEKNYAESYDLFKKTLEIHDYVYSNKLNGPNGLKFSAHDTDIVWNLAILANELKKKDEAITYYKLVADADLGDEKYAEAYDELVKKYKREDNKEQFDKYLTQAKKHYPADPYWEAVEIEFAIKGLENEELFSKYEELTVSHPNSYMVFFNYGYELVRFIYSTDAKGKDIAKYREKIPVLFKKAISINSTVEANMLMTNFYYNLSFDLLDEAAKIKGTKPEEMKKKNELTALSKTSSKECLPYGEQTIKLYAAQKEMKMSDKVNYKQMLEILSSVNKQNGNAAKAAEYDKQKAELDK